MFLFFEHYFVFEVYFKYTRLGRRLVFDDEITVQNGYGHIRIGRNFASQEGSETATNFWETEVRVENDNRKELDGYESGIRE